MLSNLYEILEDAINRPLKDWHAYRCDNGTQNLDRLSFLMDERFEVQINKIRHSKGPHCHGCNLLSVILQEGYEWWLQQYGSTKPIYMFSSPFSIITMNPEDTHWIPNLKTPSVSLCVFDHQSDWHKHYCEVSPLSAQESGLILISATWRMKQFLEMFPNRFGDEK